MSFYRFFSVIRVSALEFIIRPSDRTPRLKPKKRIMMFLLNISVVSLRFHVENCLVSWKNISVTDMRSFAMGAIESSQCGSKMWCKEQGSVTSRPN